MPESAERVVVGAGVIGLGLAAELCRRGRSVVLLERGQSGCGATHAAGGMLAPISEAEIEPPPVVALGLDSLRRYPDFVRQLEQETGLSCGFRSEGTLWVALDADDLAELQHLAGTLAARGLAAEPLDAAAVRALEPHLAHRVTGGLLAGGERQVDPRRLAAALAAAVRRHGGTIREGVEVQEIVVRDARVAGLRGRMHGTDPFEIDTRCVVLAAGAWSASGIRSPLSSVGLRPVKGQLVRLRGAASLLTRVVRTPRVYLVPREDGELLIGATAEELGFDLRPTAGAALDLLRHGREVLPGLYDLELAEISVGLRSAVDDHMPVIGACATAGLYAAFGHYRNGILLAPATAWHLAEWIEGGRAPAALEPFAPARLARAVAVD